MPELRTFNQAVGTSVVIDTGILVEYILATESGLKIKEMIFSNPFIVSVYISPLNLIELYYLFRRKNSKEETTDIINKVKELTKVESIEESVEIIGEIKAHTSFSVVDCSNLALAEKMNIKALFKHETEIDKLIKEEKNLDFITKLVFIDDFSYYKGK